MYTVCARENVTLALVAALFFTRNGILPVLFSRKYLSSLTNSSSTG